MNFQMATTRKIGGYVIQVSSHLIGGDYEDADDRLYSGIGRSPRDPRVFSRGRKLTPPEQTEPTEETPRKPFKRT